MPQKTEEELTKKGCLHQMDRLFTMGIALLFFGLVVSIGFVSGGVAGWIGAGSEQKWLGALTGSLLATGIALLLWLLVVGPLDKYIPNLRHPRDGCLTIIIAYFIGMFSVGMGGLTSGLVFNGDPKSGFIAGLVIGGFLSLVAFGKIFEY